MVGDLPVYTIVIATIFIIVAIGVAIWMKRFNKIEKKGNKEDHLWDFHIDD
jgi:hypothetical protein